MNVRPFAVFGLTVALASFAAVAAASSWQFVIPEGWVDLSPGKPVPEGVPEEVATMTQSGIFVVYGMDLKGAKDGFAENVNAVVQPAVLVADEAELARYASELPAQVRREVPGAKATVLEQGVVPIGGVPSFRFVVDVDAPQAHMRTLQYVIPGGSEAAMLTYTSTPDAFATYLPTFEKAAAATQGAAAAPTAAKLGRKLVTSTGVSAGDWQKIFGFGGKVIGAIVAVLVVGVLSRIGRRKKAAL